MVVMALWQEKALRHNDRIIVNARRCHVGTVAGYAEQYREDPVAAVERAVRLKHQLRWIGLEPSVICADPGYYAQKDELWRDAPVFTTNDLVYVADSVTGRRLFQITHAPNGNFQFIEIPD